MKRLLLLLLLAVGVACSARDGHEDVGATSSALELPTGDPVPNSWDGSAVDLLVADAWVGCSGADNGVNGVAAPGQLDSYLMSVLMRMNASACNSATATNPLERWLQLRADPQCNNRSGVSAALTITPLKFPGTLSLVPTSINNNADPILRFPAQNLCIAQKLRAASPGAAGIGTLTLSSNEQRELLEITRERAQLAALGYAKLYEIARAPVPGSTTNVLQRAREVLGDTDVEASVAAGLTASVQVLTISTEEVLELFARSAGARVPRGSVAGLSVPEENWGDGSWRSRAMAVLYGGDPLGVTKTIIPPWPIPVGPVAFEFLPQPPPFVGLDVRDPRVDELRVYATRYDLLDLKQKPLPTISSGCHDVDVNVSAGRLYRRVEAALRTEACTAFVANTCQPVSLSAIPDPNLGVTDFLLWKDHRIGVDAARALAGQLAQEIGRSCESDSVPYETIGAMNIAGPGQSVITVSNQGPDDGDYYHVGRDSAFVPHDTLDEHSGRYGFVSGFATLVDGPKLGEDPDAQQFPASNDALELRRREGSVTTLVAVAHALRQAASSPNLATPMFNAVRPAVDAIVAAVGALSLSSEPHLENQGSGLTVTESVLSVYAPQDDDFWNPADQGAISLVVVDDDTQFSEVNDDLIPALVRDPTNRSFLNITLQERLTHSVQLGVQSVTSWPDYAVPVNQWSFSGTFSEFRRAYILARKGNALTGVYHLVAGPVEGPQVAQAGLERTAIHLAFGGTLGARATQLLQVQTENPAQPFYDAFGYPLKLYPPTDPYLTGNTSGAASTKVYLDNASRAADAAVSAVTIAYQALLEKEKGQLDQTAQIARSAKVIEATKRQLCGDKKPDCGKDLKLQSIPIVRGANVSRLNQIKVDCNTLNQQAGMKELACVARDALVKYEIQVKVADPVYVALQGGDATFADYEGGSLQGVFIEQYASYRRLEDQVAQYDTAYQVAKQRIFAANSALLGATNRSKQNCGPGAFALATLAGVSGGFASVTVSAGPLIAQAQKCEDLKTEIGPAGAQAVLAMVQGIDDMQQTYMRLADAGKALGLAVAGGSATAQSAILAQDRADLDARLAALQVSNTSVFRQFHDYDVWRARALVENARRYAVLARRAIEARYVVDLTTMQAQEPFVAGPATWADQVYEYDMNMPSAVGLTIGGQQATGSVYPNAVVDYVGNLQRFVDGFAIKRPTASNLADTEVLSLPGPTGLGSGGQLPPGTIDNEAYRWTFYCASQLAWASIPANGDIDHVCGNTEQPTQARLRFDLDPWGRLKGSIANEPYQKRFNVRWSKLALNLVGTGIKDCTKAADPLTCYSQAFVRYDLTHVGPAWTTNYEQSWIAIELPKGQIEGAKALAAEQWLDPLSNAWSKPYVAQVGRTELLDRPMAGAYLATFQLGPEIVLSRVDRVQLLFDAAYWVKQQ